MSANLNFQNAEEVLNSSFTKEIQNEENLLLLNSLSSFARVLIHYGYNVPIASTKSLHKLNQISSEKKQQIREYFDNWATWIEPDLNIERTLNTSIRTEILFAKRALKHYGLVVDESFWATLQEGHVIEIYGEEMLQLYRSLSFFSYSGYSLLDISVNEWYILWERPKRVIEAMDIDVKEVMSKGLLKHKFRVQKHVLREMLNTGDTVPFIPRACIVDFQYIGALRKSPLAPPCAFICTASGEVIATGSEALNIAFV